jgi:hypothetical protein
MESYDSRLKFRCLAMNMETEVLQAVLSTEDGHMWLIEKHEWDKRRRVVVAGQGKVLNVVF